ncbi:MAG: hypothetical protein IJY39_13210 [Clostridia bacterium]|nr:hypothetical protein [Clostridia bacterium]
MLEKLYKAAPIYRNFFTSLAASISAAVFSNLIVFSYEHTLLENGVDFVDLWPNIIVRLVYPLLSIAVGILIFYYYDNLDLFNKREYYKSNSGAALITRTQYLISFAVSMLFSVLTFTNGYHSLLDYLFDADIAISRLLAVATMATLRLTQLWLLQNKWDNERDLPFFMEKSTFKRNSDPDKFKPHQMVLQPIGYTIVFALCCWLCHEYLLALIPAVLIIMIALWYVVLLLPLIPIAIGLIIRVIHNTKRRNILLRKLKQMEREGLATVRFTGYKRLSAFTTLLPLTLEVTTAKGDVYNGIVITCAKINAPMYFKPDEYMVEHGMHLRGGGLLSKGGSFGQVVDIGKMGGKENPTNMIFGYRMSHKLNFPDIEGKRIVILNPTPTTAFAVEGSEFRLIDTGEDMHKYTIYTATGFFNHVERQSRRDKYDS